MITIEKLMQPDLPEIRRLQPDGWSDIIPHYEFYLRQSFCFPIKIVIQQRIIGIGTTILHANSGWLAHIIVHPENRNQGIGKLITQTLLNALPSPGITSAHLLATAAGLPIYKKLGFIPIAEYRFFKQDHTPHSHTTPEIIQCSEKYYQAVLALDFAISGEQRRLLLLPHLKHTKVLLNNTTVTGCFMPTLGEGLILAQEQEAGLQLLNLKHITKTHTTLPSDNKAGIDFLLSKGFKEYLTGTRMVLGKEIQWQPEKIYSRIGGNLG